MGLVLVVGSVAVELVEAVAPVSAAGVAAVRASAAAVRQGPASAVAAPQGPVSVVAVPQGLASAAVARRARASAEVAEAIVAVTADIIVAAEVVVDSFPARWRVR
jgi:hypothetical protein